MRFSLLTLLGVVAVAAVGCAALTNPLPAWVMATSMATILLLCGAVLIAIECRGATRAFWRGFAICSLGYLLFLWVGFRGELYPATEGRVLPTTWALDELAEASIDQEQSRPTMAYQVYTSSATGTGTPNNNAWRCLLQIGHTVWALFFAFAGGVLARGLHKSQSHPEKLPPG